MKKFPNLIAFTLELSDAFHNISKAVMKKILKIFTIDFLNIGKMNAIDSQLSYSSFRIHLET
jgi:hypothetical protein